MKPARFTYRRAHSVGEALEWLADEAVETKVLAGGQSLVPLLNMRLAQPSALVDINPIRELETISVDDAGLRLGATVRHSDLIASTLVRDRAPLLAAATRHVGHRAIRNMGTLGGSLAHADPAAELPAVLVALGGQVVVAGRGPAWRTIPAEEMCVGPFLTSLRRRSCCVRCACPISAAGHGVLFRTLSAEWFGGTSPGATFSLVGLRRRFARLAGQEMAYADLRQYLAALERQGKLFRIQAEVERDWEIAAVTRRVFQRIPEKDRPGLLFEHVKGSDMPVTVGILGASREVYALALECRVDEIADRWADAQDNPLEPEPVASGPVKEHILLGDDADVTRLPVSTWTMGQDAGPFLTAPCVVSEDPETGERNVGTYRIQIKEPRKVGIQLSNPSRDMWTHIRKNEEQRRGTPCAIVLGADPTIGLTSVARIAYGLDEFSVAGRLRSEPLPIVKCETSDLMVPASAEIVIEGEVVCGVREPEGPFGEYTGYMSDSGDSFVIRVDAITHRDKPIFHDFFSQMPPSESSTIRGTGREMAIYKHLTRDLRMPVTDVHFLHAGGGAAFLAIAMRKKFDGQPLAAMWGAWSVDPSLAKFTVVVDDDIDVRDTFQVLWAMSWHVQPVRDVQIIQQTPPVPLDPSLAPADAARSVRRGQLGSKVGIDATRKHAYPARSVPPREHLEEVDRRWERYGLDPHYLASMAGAR